MHDASVPWAPLIRQMQGWPRFEHRKSSHYSDWIACSAAHLAESWRMFVLACGYWRDSSGLPQIWVSCLRMFACLEKVNHAFRREVVLQRERSDHDTPRWYWSLALVVRLSPPKIWSITLAPRTQINWSESCLEVCFHASDDLSSMFSLQWISNQS